MKRVKSVHLDFCVSRLESTFASHSEYKWKKSEKKREREKTIIRLQHKHHQHIRNIKDSDNHNRIKPNISSFFYFCFFPLLLIRSLSFSSFSLIS